MKKHLCPHPALTGVTSAALIVNGAINDYHLIAALLKPYERYIAVDGGLLHCHVMGIRPDLIIGDFDSIDPQMLQQYSDIPQEIFPTDKNETDLELAIRAIDTPLLKKIGIFAALEKRTDHALGNLHLMRRFPNKIIIESELETVSAIEGKKEISCYQGQTISLIPFGAQVSGVTTHGLQWELKDATLDKTFMSISNICVGTEFEISIKEGDLLCCLLRCNERKMI